MTGPVLDLLRGGLVVSCQAYPGEPMRDPSTMARVAASVVRGGAVGVRVQGPDDVAAVRAAVDVPVVGLWKDGPGPVVITPTLDHALAVADAGADVVALDATGRPRADGLALAPTIEALHRRGVLVMADVASLAEGVAAAEAGADVVASTLAGYTGSTAPRGPDVTLVADLAGTVDVPVVAEGRYHRPEQVRAALDAGAHAVVVGTAITHPATITGWFAAATDLAAGSGQG